MTQQFKRLGLTLATAVAVACAAPAAHAAYTLNFDGIAAGSDANLDPVAQANGIVFASGQLTADLDANGFEILDPSGNLVPGFTHWEAIPGANLFAADSVALGRGPAPSGANALDGRFDQVMIRFAAPTALTSISFSLDASGFGDLQARSVLLLDANGKTLGESSPFFLNSTTSFAYNFAPTSVSAILLPATKLYDNITIAAVPEPSTWALSLAGLGLVGVMTRRRRAA